MSTETHDFITCSWHTSEHDYTAECSCGWTGEDWEDLDDAQYEWEVHTDNVFYRTTIRERP